LTTLAVSSFVFPFDSRRGGASLYSCERRVCDQMSEVQGSVRQRFTRAVDR